MNSRPFDFAVVSATLLFAACTLDLTPAQTGVPAGELAKPLPLTDMGIATWKGFTGGLYPDRSAVLPATHGNYGIALGRTVRPLDANGVANNVTGKVVLLSIGMSNASQEFCADSGTSSCVTGSFMQQASADEQVNHSTLVIVNGALGGVDASGWDSPADAAYNTVRDQRLVPLGLTEKQVQSVWLKEANANPTVSLPADNADAYQLEKSLGDIVRALKVRYPNLKQVFLSSRTYAGYATSILNPEPYAYESGFAVKWLIEAQIQQMDKGHITDTRAGDLDYTKSAPWIAWGSYLWASGTTRRGDGLSWVPEDFGSDGTHPSAQGVLKVGFALMVFFKNSSQTACWFLALGQCG